MVSMAHDRLPPAILLATCCFWTVSTLAADSSAPSTPASEPYVRIAHPDTNTIQLEIAMRRFVPQAGSGVSVWLVAASHIGETNYYRELQTFLDRQNLVLFEGVGDGVDFKERSRRRRQAEASQEPSEEEELSSLQSTLAESLGLAFQLDAIDYDRRHFQNSDLSMSQLQSLLSGELAHRAQQEEGGAPNPAFVALMGAMDGSSIMGTVLHVGARLLGSSPKLQAMSRLLLIEMLGRLQGDVSQLQGLPPEFQELMLVLIRERNKVVVRDALRALREAEAPSSIAIFYGAAHMADFEKRLDQELHYRPSETRWIPAVTVQPARVGLTTAEMSWIRSIVAWQMEALREELGQGRTAP